MHITRVALVIALAGFSTCQAAAADGWLSDLDAAKAEAQRLNRPILLHFYASWCPPCMRMEKNVLNHADVLDQINASVVAAKINVEDHPELGRRFNIESLPTDVFLEPSGKHLIESNGQRTVEEYKQTIARASTRYADLLAKNTEKPEAPAAPVADSTPAPVAPAAMLSGYCPVTLWSRKKWEKGSPQFAVEHRGQTYWTGSQELADAFLENPDRYAPQLLGCDLVEMHKSDRAVAGSTKFGAFYDDELYLFSSDEHRKLFKADPDKYLREKLVFDADQIETATR